MELLYTIPLIIFIVAVATQFSALHRQTKRANEAELRLAKIYRETPLAEIFATVSEARGARATISDLQTKLNVAKQELLQAHTYHGSYYADLAQARAEADRYQHACETLAERLAMLKDGAK